MQVFGLLRFIRQVKSFKTEEKMKKFSLFLAGFGLIAMTFALQSCLDDDDNNISIAYPNALVTVKPDADNTSFCMQLADDQPMLWPVNMRQSPFGTKEVRALVNFREPTKEELEKGGTFAGLTNVYVNWIDSILTKPMAENFDEEQNKIIYGNDPVEIVNDWVTVAEDGYLTLRFRTKWGSTRHHLSLVHRTDVDTPYLVTFYHDAEGDTGDRVGDALVAFKLDELPDTEGETVDLTLQWESFSGTKTTKFKYCTRKSTGAQPAAFMGATEKNIE